MEEPTLIQKTLAAFVCQGFQIEPYTKGESLEQAQAFRLLKPYGKSFIKVILPCYKKDRVGSLTVKIPKGGSFECKAYLDNIRALSPIIDTFIELRKRNIKLKWRQRIIGFKCANPHLAYPVLVVVGNHLQLGEWDPRNVPILATYPFDTNPKIIADAFEAQYNQHQSAAVVNIATKIQLWNDKHGLSQGIILKKRLYRIEARKDNKFYFSFTVKGNEIFVSMAEINSTEIPNILTILAQLKGIKKDLSLLPVQNMDTKLDLA